MQIRFHRVPSPRLRPPLTLLIALIVFCGAKSDGAAKQPKIAADCTFRGHRLYGKIQLVRHHADLSVRVVEHFPDLRVQVVKHFPNRCGKWKLVERFPDTKIRLVRHHPDLTIRYVQHFPGPAQALR